MIDSLLNLLFRCRHRRLSRPMTPRSEAGGAAGGAYTVCLECGKRFTYDLTQMRIKPSGSPGSPPPGPALNR